jgi:hypothetical protein
MMTPNEYRFLTDQWDGPAGAAYNQTFEFVKAFGWMKGFDKDGVPVLTDLGKHEIKKFEAGADPEEGVDEENNSS